MDSSPIMGNAASELGKSLEPINYGSPNLGENEVRISITHRGVC
jgi:hypothetical protein